MTDKSVHPFITFNARSMSKRKRTIDFLWLFFSIKKTRVNRDRDKERPKVSHGNETNASCDSFQITVWELQMYCVTCIVITIIKTVVMNRIFQSPNNIRLSKVYRLTTFEVVGGQLLFHQWKGCVLKSDAVSVGLVYRFLLLVFDSVAILIFIVISCSSIIVSVTDITVNLHCCYSI